ncbi:hypothetical protein COCSADRAFT_137543 [Bipolaris sorokiniana ND90Pr]|uniref:Zn(2)-C6 fungal-type domain-containing protein n=1 Tax=Cochliobolus sativus (strain ND90Pr / ATCC 201652) TaxID=665912 RepID=M2TBE7_COCSN|nr:uncharacterized protein COCSADRAFT_137543 [Bipolaris sorokiniana ND90Pr]EMD66192.1 hypothetical protein COCSADRAFT_137543 [Bipolaris sorokiniana ND90Pr]
MSIAAGLIPVTQKASNVCAYCRVRKQRCDRTLPRCQRCFVKERHCDYTPFKEPIRQQDDDVTPLVQHFDTCLHADLTLRGAGELLHAATTWITSGGTPGAAAKLSEVVYEILDLADVDLTLALDEFGTCIQQWCPVFPTSYLYGEIEDLSQQSQHKDRLRHPLLLLCLWLVTRRTCVQQAHTTQPQLYLALKQVLALLHSSVQISVQILQISLLLAIYETGHGQSHAAYLTLSTSISLFNLLLLSPSHTPVPDWLTSSILFLSTTLSTTHLIPGFPLALLPSDPLVISLASSLPDTIPAPPPIPDATSPRKTHIRSATAVSASHVLSYTYALTHNLPLPRNYTTADEKINTLITLLIDKPQPHTWLHCDSIALAFCSHLILQLTQMQYSTLQGEEGEKVKVALRASRRMAWDMVQVGIRIITCEEEISRLPFAGLGCVVRAGVAVLETRGWVDDGEDDGVVGEEEGRAFRRLVEWVSGRWGVAGGYLRRVDEVLERRGV